MQHRTNTPLRLRDDCDVTGGHDMTSVRRCIQVDTTLLPVSIVGTMESVDRAEASIRSNGDAGLADAIRFNEGQVNVLNRPQYIQVS